MGESTSQGPSKPAAPSLVRRGFQLRSLVVPLAVFGALTFTVGEFKEIRDPLTAWTQTTIVELKQVAPLRILNDIWDEVTRCESTAPNYGMSLPTSCPGLVAMLFRIPVAVWHEALRGGWPGVLVGVIAVLWVIAGWKESWSGGPLGVLWQLGLGVLIGVMAVWIGQLVLEGIFIAFGWYVATIALFGGLLSALSSYLRLSHFLRDLFPEEPAPKSLAERAKR